MSFPPTHFSATATKISGDANASVFAVDITARPAAPFAAATRGSIDKPEVYLVLDNSGSMGSYTRRVLDSFALLADPDAGTAGVHVVTFDSTSQYLGFVESSPDAVERVRKIALPRQGGTFIFSGVECAVNVILGNAEIAKDANRALPRQVVVLLTDGRDTYRKCTKSAIDSLAMRLRGAGVDVSFVPVAVSNGADVEFVVDVRRIETDELSGAENIYFAEITPEGMRDTCESIVEVVRSAAGGMRRHVTMTFSGEGNIVPLTRQYIARGQAGVRVALPRPSDGDDLKLDSTTTRVFVSATDRDIEAGLVVSTGGVVPVNIGNVADTAEMSSLGESPQLREAVVGLRELSVTRGSFAAADHEAVLCLRTVARSVREAIVFQRAKAAAESGQITSDSLHRASAAERRRILRSMRRDEIDTAQLLNDIENALAGAGDDSRSKAAFLVGGSKKFAHKALGRAAKGRVSVDEISDDTFSRAKRSVLQAAPLVRKALTLDLFAACSNAVARGRVVDAVDAGERAGSVSLAVAEAALAIVRSVLASGTDPVDALSPDEFVEFADLVAEAVSDTGSSRSVLSMDSPIGHLARWSTVDNAGDVVDCTDLYELLATVGTVARPISVDLPDAAQMNEFLAAVNSVRGLILVDGPSMLCALQSGMRVAAPDRGMDLTSFVPVVDPSCPRASLAAFNTFHARVLGSVLVAQDLYMTETGHFLFSLACHSLVASIAQAVDAVANSESAVSHLRVAISMAYHVRRVLFGVGAEAAGHNASARKIVFDALSLLLVSINESANSGFSTAPCLITEKNHVPHIVVVLVGMLVVDANDPDVADAGVEAAAMLFLGSPTRLRAAADIISTERACNAARGIVRGMKNAADASGSSGSSLDNFATRTLRSLLNVTRDNVPQPTPEFEANRDADAVRREAAAWSPANFATTGPDASILRGGNVTAYDLGRKSIAHVYSFLAVAREIRRVVAASGGWAVVDARLERSFGDDDAGVSAAVSSAIASMPSYTEPADSYLDLGGWDVVSDDEIDDSERVVAETDGDALSPPSVASALTLGLQSIANCVDRTGIALPSFRSRDAFRAVVVDARMGVYGELLRDKASAEKKAAGNAAYPEWKAKLHAKGEDAIAAEIVSFGSSVHKMDGRVFWGMFAAVCGSDACVSAFAKAANPPFITGRRARNAISTAKAGRIPKIPGQRKSSD